MSYKTVIEKTRDALQKKITDARKQIAYLEDLIKATTQQKNLITGLLEEGVKGLARRKTSRAPKKKVALKKQAVKAAPKRAPKRALTPSERFTKAVPVLLARENGTPTAYKRMYKAYTTVIDGREGLTLKQWIKAINPDLPPKMGKATEHAVYRKVYRSMQSRFPEIKNLFNVHKVTSAGTKVNVYSLDLDAYDALPTEFK